MRPQPFLSRADCQRCPKKDVRVQLVELHGTGEPYRSTWMCGNCAPLSGRQTDRGPACDPLAWHQVYAMCAP